MVASFDLLQAEADILLEMEKIPDNDQTYLLKGPGDRHIVPLVSLDKREKFSLNITRGTRTAMKCTYQNMARKTIILARLDIDGPPHTNPDGEKFSGAHLHVYREGYGDKWAIPVPEVKFVDLSDLWVTLKDFMRYCNITVEPKFEREMFW